MMRLKLGLWVSLVTAVAGADARAADWYTGAAPPPPDDSWIVAVDASVSITSNSSQFACVTGTMALADTLRESGARLRVDGLAGSYDYRIREAGGRGGGGAGGGGAPCGGGGGLGGAPPARAPGPPVPANPAARAAPPP